MGMGIGFFGVVIPSSLLTAVVVYCLYRGARSLMRGETLAGAALLLVGLSPFLLFPVTIMRADHADSARAATVAKLDKTGPIGNYPDVLVVHGYMAESSAARLMLSAGFHAIDVRRERGRGATLNISPADGCRSALTTWQSQGAKPFDPVVKRCVVATKWPRGSIPERETAMVLARDRHASLKRDGSIWSGGNLELRLRKGGVERLVDYWEALHSTRPIFPLLVGWKGYVMKTLPKARGPGTVAFVMRNLQL